ncbi:hypothetical protein SAICODRAFT_26953 [Saitoella complicata NRRL Y-17804]|uniref:uncharacterized protein n=1 Tax=Saitoella complicata (strain BCRC 22490 / CBS 7301 / JCM 7358 / NBRC 10748 / NRRL Y-17804) TaxID=698492 RepID=UPI0008668C95|nr:uncharacterized protein SAICODRAFT_26953 [Saitoella complicata NRRL Y-17804]ODQ51196.1 hypothetical protein SAICODRAFT_26953 [Saitoella complicata NRRL Y-17804]
MPKLIREASHAGSWYSSSKNTLNNQLDGWLNAVDPSCYKIEGARVIIGPHAGYSYSGPSAAWAYKSLDTSNMPSYRKRAFILGPSHHVYLDKCALSRCSEYETPLGNLKIDRETTDKLYQTGEFAWMDIGTDTDEHSIEMHLPYTYKILSESSSSVPPIVPILVGAITTPNEAKFGKILAPYLADPENIFIVSSDFCHWGTRFSFTYYCDGPSEPIHLARQPMPAEAETPIYASIEALDGEGMQLIEDGSHKAFADYLKRTKNTICGRHPIAVVLAAIEELKAQGKTNDGKFKFVKYAQSSKVKSARDSSVSYASAYACI